ncbi:hypothetical protein K437DRAFT_268627 [Tilletiaria anomala UBC 951]|uniref:Uncharacterized protein n=1 Tax=Tilletiaria anomala (strain ATCC 24038 / CBS 436.72 / UBC 951) TaxID=1037660 RepID=A0A066VXA4_TILAU|nr:uncharacterized protein K437DRAFT_268627 [Tilletiaria anomala UBC 951]KDN44898.1 hypothetical protein K437DRAFT_268627 [Tilletiaria anomala UBC 951]
MPAWDGDSLPLEDANTHKQVFVINRALLQEQRSSDPPDVAIIDVRSNRERRRPEVLPRMPNGLSELVFRVQDLLCNDQCGDHTRGSSTSKGGGNNSSSLPSLPIYTLRSRAFASPESSHEFGSASIGLAGWLLEYAALFSLLTPAGTSRVPIELKRLSSSLSQPCEAAQDGEQAFKGPSPGESIDSYGNNLGEEDLILFRSKLILAAVAAEPEDIDVMAFSIPTCCLSDAARCLGLVSDDDGDAEPGQRIASKLRRTFQRRLELHQQQKRGQGKRSWLQGATIRVDLSTQKLPLVAL